MGRGGRSTSEAAPRSRNWAVCPLEPAALAGRPVGRFCNNVNVAEFEDPEVKRIFPASYHSVGRLKRRADQRPQQIRRFAPSIIPDPDTPPASSPPPPAPSA